MALLKNHKGEYKYQFNWMDCNGRVNGFNSVWAANKREAVKKAKAMENPAHWAWYDGSKYVTVPAEVTTGGHCFYNKGMYVKVDSMYKATLEQSNAMDRLGNMMTC
jgi:hypothetical protein